MLTVHGRTRMQFYKGTADWEAVRATVEAVSVPVVVNGDVLDVPTARLALKRSGAAAVMVGRGARGAPWLPATIASALSGRPAPETPDGEALGDLVLDHYDDALRFYGSELGTRTMRKHLGWYADVARIDRTARQTLLTESDPRAVMDHIRDAFEEGLAWAA